MLVSPAGCVAKGPTCWADVKKMGFGGKVGYESVGLDNARFLDV